MPVFLETTERRLLQDIRALGAANPFLPERIDYERRILGDAFEELGSDWNRQALLLGTHPNVARLQAVCEKQAESLRARLLANASPASGDFALYEELVLLLLYHRYHRRFDETIARVAGGGRERIGFYSDFLRDFEYFFAPVSGGSQPDPKTAARLFAGFFQVRRAFRHIFDCLIGSSGPLVRLRAQIWQSVFTRDFGRYRRGLYERMHDIASLVTGPTGTGKELVARAIGLSRYIPFDAAAQRFTEDFSGSFVPLNLSALSPTLIESELFGHKRGAFTGALQDRIGWLESCPERGTVFLDEIGEVEPRIQVKLLRVIQERVFSRLGDAEARRFKGKLIAATNRNLAREMHEGRFRHDLYYRLCADLIVTPSLREQLDDTPAALDELVLFLARRAVGVEEAPLLAEETLEWVHGQLGPDYAWPGNVRELEQCVRNVLVRGEYHPARTAGVDTVVEALQAGLSAGTLGAEDLLRGYCSLVYARRGSYRATGEQLGLDQRTVKAKVDAGLVARIREEEAAAAR